MTALERIRYNLRGKQEDLEIKRQNMIEDAQSIRDKAAEVVRRLKGKCPNVNELGEFQSMTTIFDARCGLFTQLQTEVANLEWVLKVLTFNETQS